MTPPRTPEDEPDNGPPQGGSPEEPAAPPPPQWLTESQDSDDGPLLPEVPPLPPDFGASQEPASQGGEGGRDIAEETIGDFDSGEPKATEAFQLPSAPAAGTGTAEPGTGEQGAGGGLSPNVTVTDLSAFLPPPADSDGTRMDMAPPPEAPAPPEQAGQQENATQQIPAPPQESGPPPPPFGQSPPAPFPYAQHIPDTPPPPQAPPPQQPDPPAPEPFPWAQEMPPAPAAPFPYAQQVPGQEQGGPQPFPYGQEVPGHNAPQPPADPSASPGPLAPPPQIDEPWRTPPARKRPGQGGKVVKRVLLVAGAGLAVAALALGGFVVVSNLGGDEEKGGGARLAGSVFPVNAGARTDGRDQEITSVTAAGSTVVAVGGETGPQSARGLFLVSTDGGRTFKAADVTGAGGGAPAAGEVPAAVGGSDKGWVAIGVRNGGGAVWTSENGQDWRREPDAVGNVFGPNNRIHRIVPSGNGFLAIGENSPKGDFTDSVPAVWLSDDGRSWEPRIGDQIGLQVRDAEMSLVEAAASGGVVLLEALITPEKREQGGFRRVWRSEDGGRTWADSAVPVPKGSRGLNVGGGPNGFIAIREIKSGGKSYGQAFSSSDGASWTQAGRLETDGYRVTTRVLGDGRGFAAVVTRGRDVLVARSEDGASWRDAGTLEIRPGREIKGAALAGDHTVAVGREPGGGDLDPLLNVWDAGGGAVPVDLNKVSGALRPDHAVVAVGATGDRVVSVGSAAGDAAVWTSQDGDAWKPAQGLGAAFTRPGSQQLVDVANGGAGWLAVGYDQVTRHPLAVTSADGTTWQAVDNGAAFRGSSNAQPTTNAAAAGQAGYVIVGTEGRSAAAWFSADLKAWERGRSGGPDGALESRGGDARWMLDVAGGPSGFTAVGGVRDPKAGNRPTVWSSADGKQWTLQHLPLPGGSTEGHLTHVAAKGSTMVAAGVVATPEGLGFLGYVSPDGGKTWQELQAPGGDGKALVTSLVSTPKGFAATGTTGRPGSADVVAWASADGSSWTAEKPGGTGLGGDGDQQVTGLAPFKDRLIGVGRTAGGDGEQPVLWDRPVP